MTTKKTPEKTMALVPYNSELIPLNLTDTLPISKRLEDQINLLTMPTPPKFIKRRLGRGGKVFDYIEANYVIARLNATFLFDWSTEITWQDVDRKEKQVAVRLKLKVRFLDGKEVTKEAYGSSEIKMTKTGDQVDFADDLKAAESDAIKKAASMLGIGYDVYSGLAKAAPESVDTEEPDDFLAETTKEDPDKFRNITLQLANGKSVLVSKFEALGYFGKVKAALGEAAYYVALKLSGFEKSNEIPPEKIPQMYTMLCNAFKTMRKVQPEFSPKSGEEK